MILTRGGEGWGSEGQVGGRAGGEGVGEMRMVTIERTRVVSKKEGEGEKKKETRREKG